MNTVGDWVGLFTLLLSLSQHVTLSFNYSLLTCHTGELVTNDLTEMIESAFPAGKPLQPLV